MTPRIRPVAALGVAALAACATASSSSSTGTAAGTAASAATAAPTGTPAAAPAPSSTGDAAESYVYVPNQDDATISIVDPTARREVARIDLTKLGFSEHAKPHDVVVEPDGSFWYLSLIGENRVLKFDRNNRLVGSAPFEVPGMMALNPRTDLLYVGRSMSAVNPPPSIGVIRRSDMTRLDEVEVLYPRPHPIAVAPDGAVVYSGSLAENSIAVLDSVGDDVEVSHYDGPVNTYVQFAISPDGRTLVATGQMTGQLLVFDLADPDHPKLTHRVAVGAQPWHPSFSPDGKMVWFGNKEANTVTAVDAGTWTVASVVKGNGIAEPHGSAVSADGRWVYVSNNNLKGEYTPRAGKSGHPVGTLVIIDAATDSIAGVVEVGHDPTGIGTRPRR